MAQTSVLEIKGYDPDSPYAVHEVVTIAAENEVEYNTIPQMEKAARDLDFMEAARLRDEMFRLQKELAKMK